jgi:hypothetical protein
MLPARRTGDFESPTLGGIRRQQMQSGVLDNPANIQRVKIFIGNGSNDNPFGDATNLVEELKRRG